MADTTGRITLCLHMGPGNSQQQSTATTTTATTTTTTATPAKGALPAKDLRFFVKIDGTQFFRTNVVVTSP